MKKSLIIVAICVLSACASVFSDFPNYGIEDEVFVDGKSIKVEDGFDLSNQQLRGIHLHRHNKPFININFSGSSLFGSYFEEAYFENCDFSGCDLQNVNFQGSSLDGCNLQDANISGACMPSGLTAEQLESTINYQNKDLSRTCFLLSDLSGVDFSDFILTGTSLDGSLENASFDNAEISEIRITSINGFDIKQLMETKNYRDGFFPKIYVNKLNFPEKGIVDFSQIVFSQCKIVSPPVGKLNLTDSVISGCDFSRLQCLTLENVKSTWNYKHGRMAGIKLPPDIQKTIDEEMKK
ncbi:MAG: pentapeptide repeat-containing protein [Thermoguttaceae bacterium]